MVATGHVHCRLQLVNSRVSPNFLMGTASMRPIGSKYGVAAGHCEDDNCDEGHGTCSRSRLRQRGHSWPRKGGRTWMRFDNYRVIEVLAGESQR
jgi:hypothetical protein